MKRPPINVMPDDDRSPETTVPDQNTPREPGWTLPKPTVPALLLLAIVFIVGIACLHFAQPMDEKGFWKGILTHTGQGLVAAVFITLVLEILWFNERAKSIQDAFKPSFDKLRTTQTSFSKSTQASLKALEEHSSKILGHISTLDGRFEAYRKLGLDFCHPSRAEALQHFHNHAERVLNKWKAEDEQKGQDSGVQASATKQTNLADSEDQGRKYVNVVSSSARGLIGYLNQEDDPTREKWRKLIVDHHARFRFLLTHPAYAHLRQAAEERGPGDIELEILKAAMFFHVEAKMDQHQLRFYRGSPTTFLIQADDHILLNPYSYGRMAMQTLSLEFERPEDKKSGSYIEDFVHMHFHHIWAFQNEPGKQVDGKSLVVGVSCFGNILEAFGECTFAGPHRRLRLTRGQVTELDLVANEIAKKHVSSRPADWTQSGWAPFQSYAAQNGLDYCLADYSGGHQKGVDVEFSTQDKPAGSGV